MISLCPNVQKSFAAEAPPQTPHGELNYFVFPSKDMGHIRVMGSAGGPRRTKKVKNHCPGQTQSGSYDPLQRYYGQVREMAAMDPILNFSKCLRVTEVHPADSEIGPLGYTQNHQETLLRGVHAVAAQTARSRCKVPSIQYVY